MALIRLAADIGGTFTDIALETPNNLYTTKVLTTPQEPATAVLQGIEDVLIDAKLRASDVDVFVHGTTLATNALIERSGAVTALLTTAGMRDSVEMAHENRFEQYDLAMTRPEPLVPRDLRFGIAERLDSTGRVLRDLDIEGLEVAIRSMKENAVESVAIGFLHSYINAEHEQRAADFVRTHLPDAAIALSSEVCPEIREYERLSTTCANAYIQPLLTRYLEDLESRRRSLGMNCPMLLMQSGGGLGTLDDALRFPVRLVESGPAGGALLSAELARSFQLDKALSFDMGGTTAKLCIINGGYPRTSREFEVGREYRFLAGSGLPLRLPVIEMVEIGAGGSSIAQLDELGRIAVGPTSAGSEPGPACYGRGGEAATVTDADVTLGRILPEGFSGGDLNFSKQAALQAIASTLTGEGSLDTQLAAIGIVETVDENMASAGRVHAIEQGCDITNGTLIAFGGAAPLHAVRVAEKLGISDVIVPSGAGVGSAIGFLHAPASHENVRTRYVHLDALDVNDLTTMLEEMLNESELIVRRASQDSELSRSAKAFMRYAGQGHEITVDLDLEEILCTPRPDAAHLQKVLEEAFVDEYRRLYGREITGLGVETLSWVATVSSPPRPTPLENSGAPRQTITDLQTTMVADSATATTTPTSIVGRDDLQGFCVQGPALITEDQTTTFVPASYRAWLTESGHLRIQGQNVASNESNNNPSQALETLHRDIMWNRLIAVVQEQATTLVRSAFSTSTREAGDLSAGVFDPQGRMLAQSVTGTPGHVNSMAASVGHFLDEFPVHTMRPGDIYLTNDPWKGTGHLFDVVVVTPVFRGDRVVALFACTSHVVDIGGVGFSSASREIFHEGLQLPIMRFATEEVFDPNVVKIIETNVRDSVQVMGDIYSLAACNRVGALRLIDMMDEYDLDDLDDLGEYIIETSRSAMLKEIAALPSGTWRSSMRVDGVDKPLDIMTELTISEDGIAVSFD
ncbi:MAG: hydantoinase/oxoprolinase family protein, partial [Acidimicrobiales bacterium]|nr:hydantoinase/oxoprolinase family protein [Acidimicrobiales bacterium]